MELKLYVTIHCLPEEFFADENYHANMEMVKESLHILAEDMGGDIHDIEIK
jgi:hypothetical protein